jgi:hypothetical protein
MIYFASSLSKNKFKTCRIYFRKYNKKSKTIKETKIKESLFETQLMDDGERKDFEYEIKERKYLVPKYSK